MQNDLIYSVESLVSSQGVEDHIIIVVINYQHWTDYYTMQDQLTHCTLLSSRATLHESQVLLCRPNGLSNQAQILLQ